MGSKQSTQKTTQEKQEKSSSLPINIHADEHQKKIICVLFPNFGASTFIRQICENSEEGMNESNLRDCCRMVLCILKNNRELCSLDSELERYNRVDDDYSTISDPKAILVRMWTNQETRRIILENYEFTPRLDNLKLFMDYLQGGMFESKGSKNPLLYISNRTTGMLRQSMRYQNQHFNLIEVGGTRNDWKKGIHCLDTIDIILFFFGLSDFDTDMEHVYHKYHYISRSKRMGANTNFRFMMVYTKPDVLQDKLRRGIVYEYEEKYAMLEELECISNVQEREVVNSIVNRFTDSNFKKTEFHIVNLICKEEVLKFKEWIFSGQTCPFISKSLTDNGHILRSNMWKEQDLCQLTDVLILCNG